MRTLFTLPEVGMPAGTLLSGVAEKTERLQVVRGCVWITIEGDHADYWLSSGDCLVIPPQRLVVVEAESGGAVLMRQLAATVPARSANCPTMLEPVS